MKMNWTLDFETFRSESKAVSESLRDMRYTVLRKSHVDNGGPVATAMFQTHMEKKKATLLCSLRAHHRNKVHQQGWTLEQQEEYLDKHSSEWEHLLRFKNEVVEEAAQEVAA